MGIGDISLLELIPLVLIMILMAYVFGRIWSKTSFPGWVGILMIVPIVNLVATIFPAFPKEEL